MAQPNQQQRPNNPPHTASPSHHADDLKRIAELEQTVKGLSDDKEMLVVNSNAATQEYLKSVTSLEKDIDTLKTQATFDSEEIASLTKTNATLVEKQSVLDDECNSLAGILKSGAPAPVRHDHFISIMSHEIVEMLVHEKSPHDAKRNIAQWLHMHKDVMRDEIERDAARIKGTVEAVTQELPLMIVGRN